MRKEARNITHNTENKRKSERYNIQDISLEMRQEMQCTKHAKARDETRNVMHKIYKGKKQGERRNLQDIKWRWWNLDET